MATWRPIEPTWAAPPRLAIADEMWLAYRAHVDTGRPVYDGVVAAAAWVRGGRPAPVTERDEQPVTLGLAEVELLAAMVANEPSTRVNLPVDGIAADHGVSWREPVRVDPDYAGGAWRALRWLTGVPDQRAPLPVPVRNPDGTLVTADQLCEQAIAANPHRDWEAEQRVELRNWATTEVARSRSREALIVDTQRQLSDAIRARGPASA
jgi:hypothetical protein